MSLTTDDDRDLTALQLHYGAPPDFRDPDISWLYKLSKHLFQVEQLYPLNLHLSYLHPKDVTHESLFLWLSHPEAQGQPLVGWQVGFSLAQLMGLGDKSMAVSITARDTLHRLSGYPVEDIVDERGQIQLISYLLSTQDLPTSTRITDHIASLSVKRAAGEAPSTFQLQCDIRVLVQLTFRLAECQAALDKKVTGLLQVLAGQGEGEGMWEDDEDQDHEEIKEEVKDQDKEEVKDQDQDHEEIKDQDDKQEIKEEDDDAQ
jgi:hypothetical protein